MFTDQIKKVFSEENVNDVLSFAKTQILNVAGSQLNGQEKKEKVTEMVITQIMKVVKLVDFPGIDKIWDEIIESILKTVVPILVEHLYQALKLDTSETLK